MKIENPPHPFTKYNCYKLFHEKLGRYQVCLVHKESKKRRSLLYSKYLMSIKVGRILKREEEVDHLDGDKTNDSIDNLEIVTREENKRRYYNTLSRAKEDFVCPICGKEFSRERHLLTHNPLYKREGVVTCSRSCGGKYGHKQKTKCNTHHGKRS